MHFFYYIIIYIAIPWRKLISIDIAIGLLIYDHYEKFPLKILAPSYLNTLAATFYVSEFSSPKDKLNPPF